MYILSYLSKKSISDFNKDRFNMEIIVVLNVISGFTVLKQCRRIRKRQKTKIEGDIEGVLLKISISIKEEL